MRRRNRELSIFSMSSLDLFASALGAFILLTIVVFPYFLNTGMASRPAPERQQIEGTGDESGMAIQEELDRTRAERAAAQQELALVREENARLSQVEAANEVMRQALVERGGSDQGLLRIENAQLLQEQELLRAESTRLLEELADQGELEIENVRLVQEQETLRTENARLLQGQESLRAENVALREDLSSQELFQAGNARLLQDQGALQEERARLLQGQESLRAENAVLRENLARHELLQAENAQLRQDLENRELLRAENSQLREDQRAQESLRVENAQLKERFEARLAGGGESRDRSLQEALERERRRKFLAVMISWPGGRGDDVDLHVVDPRGDEFFYGARVHEGSPARFEEDSRHGPGNEVWLHPHVAAPGEYRIYYSLFDGGPVTVRGTIVASSSDRHELAPRTLDRVGEKLLAATVIVDGDSNVEVVR